MRARCASTSSTSTTRRSCSRIPSSTTRPRSSRASRRSSSNPSRAKSRCCCATSPGRSTRACSASENPLGYHLGNVLLNAANVALLFLFLARATRRFGLSLAVAGVFAVLPVHVEPVSWVMGRKDTLSAFFVLAALLAQSYQLDEPDAHRRRQLYLATLLCTCLALVSKIAAMPCFLLLALHRIFHPYLDGRRAPDAPFGVLRTLRDAIPPVLPHAVLTVAIVAWYQAAVAEYGVTGWRGRGPLDPQHLANVAAFTPLVIGSYLKSLAWPVAALGLLPLAARRDPAHRPRATRFGRDCARDRRGGGLLLSAATRSRLLPAGVPGAAASLPERRLRRYLARQSLRLPGVVLRAGRSGDPARAALHTR